MANVSITNQWSICNADYRQIANECDNNHMSPNDIGRAWQTNLSNKTMDDVNALSEMVDIRNAFKRCQILYDGDVNNIITDISGFFFNIVPLPC